MGVTAQFRLILGWRIHGGLGTHATSSPPLALQSLDCLKLLPTGYTTFGDIFYIKRDLFNLIKKVCWDKALHYNLLKDRIHELKALSESLQYKLINYEYESEYRAIVICNKVWEKLPPNHCKIEKGFCQVPCDYDALVKSIVLHPKYKQILMPRDGFFHYSKKTIANALLVHKLIRCLISAAYMQSGIALPVNSDLFHTSDAYHLSISDDDPNWLSPRHVQMIESYLASSGELERF